MNADRSKAVKSKRVARAGKPPTGGKAPEPKHEGGPLGKGKMASGPAPVARAPRVTAPGDAEEVQADRAAARVAVGKQTGPIDQAPPAAARRVESETPPEAEQIPVARAGAKQPPAGGKEEPAVKPAGTTNEPAVKRAAEDEKAPPVARAAVDEQAPPRTAPAPVTDAIASPGQGRPLAHGTRQAIEQRMPVDLRGVRVHDDAAAKEAAGAIGARAFTHGRDIWLGRGESDRDVGLIAHEAAHVAQQRDGGGPEVAPKKGSKKPKVTGPLIDRWPEQAGVKDAPGFIEPGAKTLRVAKLKVPDFKAKQSEKPDLKYHKRSDQQREIWDAGFPKAPDIEAALPRVEPLDVEGAKEPIYYLKPKKGTSTFVIGNREAVMARGRRPSWTPEGKPHKFDVDHIKEVQLGGPDKDIKNMWLLDFEANRSSGSLIKTEIEQKIAAVLDAAPDNLRDKPDVETVRSSYTTVTADKIVRRKDYAGDGDLRYTEDDIKEGKGLKGLKKVPEDEALALGGSPGKISLFDRKEGGRHRFVTLRKGEGQLKNPKLSKSLEVLGVHYSPETKKGSVTAMLFKEVKGVEQIAVDNMAIEPIPGITYGGYVSPYVLRDALNKQLKPKGLSAVTMDAVDFDWEQGLVASGGLTPSIPLIDKVGIELRIDGEGIYLSKVFSGDELAFPGPIKVLGSSLEVRFGTMGFGLKGRVPFLIEGFGKGVIEASASAGRGEPTFELVGTLELDTELFDKAEVTVRYRDGKFSGAGTLEIGPSKVKGVKSATITAAIEEERIEAKGDVVMAIPGVQSGAVSLVYDKTTGLEVTGTLQLSNSIPALKSGTIEVTLRKKPEGRYAVSGAIKAEAGIPGITATITGSYEDGAFVVSGTAGYERGMLKGSVTVGATNRPIGDDGKPAGEPTEKLSAYGRGEVTVRLAPWLQGSAAIEVLPNGELVITGKIGLPSTLDLFEEKKIAKRIFTIALDIPIVGFSVLGQRVGIFATIGGGLDAEAAIGPGQLRKAELGITYKPSDEAATHVSGGASLYIPAHAGLRLFVRGGVGAGIPIVSATVGLEVGAALGLEAALESGLQVDWTPAKGLVLDAALSAYVQPKFKFDLTAFAEVTVDYLFGSSTLYDEHWQLAAFEYGSNLHFGVKFPVHYEEGEKFDVALSDVEFEYPQIDPGALLKGLVAEIV